MPYLEIRTEGECKGVFDLVSFLKVILPFASGTAQVETLFLLKLMLELLFRWGFSGQVSKKEKLESYAHPHKRKCYISIE